MRRGAVPVALWAALAAQAHAASERNLYEWMAVAPIVVAGRVVADDGRHVELLVEEVFRGDAAAGALLLLDQRRANLGRPEGTPPLRLERGMRYLVLLETDRARDGGTVYALVRGTHGARPLPEEGAAVWVEAASRLAALQERRDEEAVWSAFGEMLSADNPVLLDTALDMLGKFGRAEPGLLPRLRPLFSAPRPGIRGRALGLAGEAVRKSPAAELPDAEGLLVEIIGRARRDESPEVRGAAVEALGAFPGRRVETVLRQIAREDPEQEVRYRAERALYERREERQAPRGRKG